MIAPLILASQIGLGINYDWWKMVPVSEKQCRADSSARNAGEWFLPSYDNPALRLTVRAQLRAMRRSGFTTLRVLVFFYHSTDESSADSFTSLDGSMKPADRVKLYDFVSDVAAAKFQRLEVVPSFQAENELYCRTKVWGDCFDANRAASENWRFIETVARTSIAAAGTMQLRFDLGNEAAPDPSMPASTLANAKRYLQEVAGRFQHEFGIRWTISAARSNGSPAGETSNRLELLLADLGEAGLVPKALELHTYSNDAGDVAASLDEANGIAQRIGASLVLGELRYHSTVQANAIAGWLQSHRNSHVADLIQWPEYDPTAICNLNPVPPYTPGPLGKALSS